MTHDLRQEAHEANETHMGSGNHSWPRVSGALLLHGLEQSLWGAGDKPGLGFVEKGGFPGQQEVSPIPAGSHIWLTCRKTGREGASHAHCRRVSHAHRTEESSCRVLKQAEGCDKTFIWRDGVRVHQDRLEETRTSLCYSPASQHLLKRAGRTVDYLVITEFRIFMNSVYPFPKVTVVYPFSSTNCRLGAEGNFLVR